MINFFWKGLLLFRWVLFRWVLFRWVLFRWVLFRWVLFRWVLFGRRFGTFDPVACFPLMVVRCDMGVLHSPSVLVF